MQRWPEDVCMFKIRMKYGERHWVSTYFRMEGGHRFQLSKPQWKSRDCAGGSRNTWNPRRNRRGGKIPGDACVFAASTNHFWAVPGSLFRGQFSITIGRRTTNLKTGWQVQGEQQVTRPESNASQSTQSCPSLSRFERELPSIRSSCTAPCLHRHEKIFPLIPDNPSSQPSDT